MLSPLPGLGAPDALRALAADGKTPHEQRGAVQRSAVVRGVVDHVHLSMDDVAVLGVSILESFNAVHDATREAVVAHGDDVVTVVQRNGADLGAAILAELLDRLGDHLLDIEVDRIGMLEL